MRRYLLNLLVSLDQLLNTLFGGNPDETVSSRVGRGAIKGSKLALVLEKLINSIFNLLGDDNHCRKRIEWEETDRG